MATREELEKALRNADKAGDVAAAKRFADELRKPEYVGVSGNVVDPNNAPRPDAQSEFDQLPFYMKPVKAADDLLRVGSDALTFGFLDKLRAAVGTQPSVEAAREETDRARDRSGAAGTAAAVGSSMLPVALTAGATAVPQAGITLRTLLGGLEGAAFGGLDALGHDEDVVGGQLSGAAFGAGGTLAAGAIGGLLDSAINAFTPKGQRQTPRDLRLSKDRAYQAVEDEGIRYTPKAVDGLVGELDDAMADSWPTNHPLSTGALAKEKKTLPGYRTPLEIDNSKQAVRRNTRNKLNEGDEFFGNEMLGRYDDWMDSRDWSDVTSFSGDPNKALPLLDDARSKAKRLSKVEELDERVGKASRRADRNLYSGVDSTLKQNVGGILDDPKRRAKYTPDEQAKMEEINAGTTKEKLLRNAGRAAPGGGLAWPAASVGGTIGFGIGGPVGAAVGAGIPMAAGYVSKKLGERSTVKSVEELLDMVSSGRAPSKHRTSPKTKQELADILMMLGITSGGD